MRQQGLRHGLRTLTTRGVCDLGDPLPRLPAENRTDVLDGEAIARWKVWTPIAFIGLVLVALVVAPLHSYREMRSAQQAFSTVVIPGRILAGRITGAIARGTAAIRTYAITGDERLLESYEAARASEQQTFERLRVIAPRARPQIQERLEELEWYATRLHARQRDLLTGRLSRDAFVAQLAEQDTLFEATLAAASRFSVTMDAVVGQEMRDLQEANGLNLLLSAVGGVLALAALVLLFRIGRELRRRTREETSLRKAGLALAEAARVEDVLYRITDSAVEAGYGLSAHVELIDTERHEVEVVATAGPGGLPIGSRVPYPGSLAEEVLDTGRAEIVPEIGRAGRPISGMIAERCGSCAGLVVPLITDSDPQGALVLLRRGKSSYRPRDALAPRILGVLAAVALRRASLLDTAEAQRRQLETLMASKERLTRGLSHDLKNPLAAADGYAQLLEGGVLDGVNASQKRSLGRIRASIHSAIELIDELHELARAEAGQLSIQPEPVDVSRLGAETTEDHRAGAQAAGLDLAVERVGPIPLIRTDPRRVRQVLGNLLSNAIKYTPAGGRVRVRLETCDGSDGPGRGEWAAVRVSDTGPGIPEEQREQIFVEFSRLDPAAKRGAGLGLAIARRVARLLGGDITVESEVGQGSTFTFWLPLRRVSEGEAEPRAA